MGLPGSPPHTPQSPFQFRTGTMLYLPWLHPDTLQAEFNHSESGCKQWRPGWKYLHQEGDSWELYPREVAVCRRKYKWLWKKNSKESQRSDLEPGVFSAILKGVHARREKEKNSLRFLPHLAKRRGSVSKLKRIISRGGRSVLVWGQAAYYFLLKPTVSVQQQESLRTHCGGQLDLQDL